MSYITIKDILESAKKYGDSEVLTWNPEEFRDNKKNQSKTGKKTAAFDCTWVPIKFKFINGQESQLKLKFNKVITASGAKFPSQSDPDTVKNMLIAFRKLSKDEILSGDYAPKEMESKEKQNIENKRAEESAKVYLQSTDDFNLAMEIIDLSYGNICNQIKDASTLAFTVRKDKKFKTNEDVSVYSIRQTHRENSDDGSEVKLEYPFTRIKLMLGKDNGQVGIEFWNNDTRGWNFKPNVYDSRKMTAKNNYEPVLAKVKVDGKLCPLDSKNVGSFITYKSVVGGIIEFPEIVISKFGLSLSNKFKELYVRRHKTNVVEAPFSREDIKDMHDGDSNEDDDSDAEMVKDEENNSDLEDHDTSDRELSDSELEDVAKDLEETGLESDIE